jgi:type III secretory pathway component EscT
MAKPPEPRNPAQTGLMVMGAGLVIGGIIGLLAGNIAVGAVLGFLFAVPVYIVAQRIGGGPDA